MSTGIVCGHDGSPDSGAALEVAADLSKRLGSRLVLAHIAEVAHVPYTAAYSLGGMAGPTAVANEIDAEERAGERLLEQAAHAARAVDAERRAGIHVRRRGQDRSRPPHRFASHHAAGGSQWRTARAVGGKTRARFDTQQPHARSRRRRCDMKLSYVNNGLRGLPLEAPQVAAGPGQHTAATSYVFALGAPR